VDAEAGEAGREHAAGGIDPRDRRPAAGELGGGERGDPHAAAALGAGDLHDPRAREPAEQPIERGHAGREPTADDRDAPFELTNSRAQRLWNTHL
jgi:hypothetical protein